jgi:hypothetical protein
MARLRLIYWSDWESLREGVSDVGLRTQIEDVVKALPEWRKGLAQVLDKETGQKYESMAAIPYFTGVKRLRCSWAWTSNSTYAVDIEVGWMGIIRYLATSEVGIKAAQLVSGATHNIIRKPRISLRLAPRIRTTNMGRGMVAQKRKPDKTGSNHGKKTKPKHKK